MPAKYLDPDLFLLNASLPTDLKQQLLTDSTLAKVIAIGDFLEAAQLLRTGTVEFHNERMATLMLQENQVKP